MKQKEDIQLKANAQQQEVFIDKYKDTYGRINRATESDKQINAQITAHKAQQQEIENMITQSIVRRSTYELSYAGGVMIWPTLKVWLYYITIGNRMHQFR